VRYAGHAGPIDVSARREGHEVVLVVADRGPGVEESVLPHLFEPFYRPDSSRANATGGAGLGLSIVKTCVEACGGGANAHNREAEERGGFVVELRLPAARSA
jgi:two-component system sensor histidine kinase CpxA